ncbi:LysM peptidoglycan-binding domain-containing protein [Alkalicoccus luteus]|uniref:LysM peptidoglycan-binding domain-containing protein n=1 Tax=Alkalicoccus luteus TaxID=1237094 RepID=UPI004034BCAC
MRRTKLMAGTLAAAGATMMVGGFSVSAEDVTHSVAEGETMYSIAEANTTVTLDELQDMNPDADPYNLQIGEQLTITAADDAGSGVETHVVQEGETFDSIASEHDEVTADDLDNWNADVDRYDLQQGMHVVVEAPISVNDAAPDGAYHHADEGENFHSIARQYHDVTANELIEMNHSVYSDEISIGQMIQLDPQPLE